MFIKSRQFFMGVMATLSLSACEGVFSQLYDDPLATEKNEFGFISVDEKTHTGKIYIDATDYTKWHYIQFKDKAVITRPVTEQIPQQWDIAIHRYDAKTNGGAVFETNATSFQELPPINSLPNKDFVVDEWTKDKIAIDLSQMMDGHIQYVEDFYNPCLSKWLHVDKSSMPPRYTLSGKIYLLRLSDATYAALRLSNFMNNAATKGFMTIDYFYPVDQK